MAALVEAWGGNVGVYSPSKAMDLLIAFNSSEQPNVEFSRPPDDTDGSGRGAD